MELKRIAMDTSKYAFTLHGVDAEDRVVLRRGPEACGASHHWGRVLQRLGHRVRLIPAQYVKPFVKRGKSDRIDAQAIAEAAARPGMRFVPVRAAEAQAAAMLLSVRALLVRQRTQVANALRGHAAEFGLVAAKGIGRIEALMAAVEAAAMPAAAKEALGLLANRLDQLDAELAALDRRLAALHAANPLSQLLAAVPGIGPLTALTLALSVAPERFANGRHFAAWLGLTPKLHATAGRPHRGAPRSVLRGDPVWAGSAVPATNACANSWCSAPPR